MPILYQPVLIGFFLSARTDGKQSNELPEQIEAHNAAYLSSMNAPEIGNHLYLYCHRNIVSLNRPFHSLEKGSEESAAHSESLGNRRKPGDKRLAFVSVLSPCKLESFFIYLRL